MSKLREAFFWYGHKALPFLHKWNYEDAQFGKVGHLASRHCKCGKYELGRTSPKGRWVRP